MIPIFSFSSAQGMPPWVPDFTGMTAKEWVPNVKIIPLAKALPAGYGTKIDNNKAVGYSNEGQHQQIAGRGRHAKQKSAGAWIPMLLTPWHANTPPHSGRSRLLDTLYARQLHHYGDPGRRPAC
jgi:hypothetical protein